MCVCVLERGGFWCSGGLCGARPGSGIVQVRSREAGETQRAGHGREDAPIRKETAGCVRLPTGRRGAPPLLESRCGLRGWLRGSFSGRRRHLAETAQKAERPAAGPPCAAPAFPKPQAGSGEIRLTILGNCAHTSWSPNVVSRKKKNPGFRIVGGQKGSCGHEFASRCPNPAGARVGNHRGFGERELGKPLAPHPAPAKCASCSCCHQQTVRRRLGGLVARASRSAHPVPPGSLVRLLWTCGSGRGWGRAESAPAPPPHPKPAAPVSSPFTVQSQGSGGSPWKIALVLFGGGKAGPQNEGTKVPHLPPFPSNWKCRPPPILLGIQGSSG